MKINDQLEPTVFVIFGGAGDLTWRKLVPALFDLSQDNSIPAQFSVIAVDRVPSWPLPTELARQSQTKTNPKSKLPA